MVYSLTAREFEPAQHMVSYRNIYCCAPVETSPKECAEERRGVLQPLLVLGVAAETLAVVPWQRTTHVGFADKLNWRHRAESTHEFKSAMRNVEIACRYGCHKLQTAHSVTLRSGDSCQTFRKEHN